jgi:hypothetical protein
MSVDTIAMVISAATLLLGFVGAFAWMIKRTDEQHEGLERRLGERISGVERELGERISDGDRVLGARISDGDRVLGERISSFESTLGDQIAGVQRELVEVKIAVARIEGPPRHLIPVR